MFDLRGGHPWTDTLDKFNPRQFAQVAIAVIFISLIPFNDQALDPATQLSEGPVEAVVFDGLAIENAQSRLSGSRWAFERVPEDEATLWASIMA